jgi:NADH-quinone oxidoreductase subunit H
MSVLEIVFFSAKAFFVVMFAMNVGVLLTWADRRGGAMLQDRVGPERAVIWLPRRLAQGLAFAPALLVGLGAVGYAYLHKDELSTKTGNAMLMSHAAIFMTWLTALIIGGAVRRRGARNSFDAFIQSIGDPRTFFYIGLALHVGAILAAGLLRGTELGQTLRDLAYSSGTFVFAAAVVGGALYAVLQMKGDRVGLRLAGLLHPAADGLKFAFKEDIIPPGADKVLHSIAPIISVFPVLVVLAIVPFGDTLCFGVATAERIAELEQAGGFGAFYANLIRPGGPDLLQLATAVPREGVCIEGAVPLQVVDLNIGILYFFALAGTGIVGAALAGWASDNKFSLLGGLRAASQMVSYEVTLGLTVIGALMIYGTVRVDEMVRWQADNTWGIFVQPLAFVLFFAAAIAESKRIPFDLPEGESEIVSGYFTEYSGMKFSMFMFAEYVAVVTSAALMVALFLGGWHLPFLERDGLHIAIGETELLTQPMSHGAVVFVGFLGFILKTIALCLVKMTIRWTLPRFRYDQLMRLGWRKILPLSLINILVTGMVMLAIQSASPSVVEGLGVAGQVSEAVVAIIGIVAGIAFVRFLLKPAEHRRVLSSTSARFAAWAGGTKTAKLGA